MRAPLNLARRPLRNDRLPTLALSLALVALAAATAYHALAAWELRAGGRWDVAGELLSLEAEMDRLASEADDLSRLAPTKEQQEEWRTVRGLIDHRRFSWTGLLAAFEEVLPPSVRLVSVAPDRDQMITLDALGRDYADGVELLRALQRDARFREARLFAMSQNPDGVSIDASVRYLEPARPTRTGGSAPAARPASTDGATPADDPAVPPGGGAVAAARPSGGEGPR